jgi:predicted HicB family RNase H-like nuclease
MQKQTIWSRTYNDKAYDRLAINVHKGRKAEIQALAAAQGKSLNQYVVDAIDAAGEIREIEGKPDEAK